MHHKSSKWQEDAAGSGAGFLLKPLWLMAQNPHRKVRDLCTLLKFQVAGKCGTKWRIFLLRAFG